MKRFLGYQKGINLGGWLSQCDHNKEHYDSFITEDDIKRIASWGLDHVRLPVDYELVETDRGDFMEDGFRYIDSCLEWCEKYGLNMILDLHRARGYSFDESETSGGFFKDTKLQDDFVDLWKVFARRYGKYANRLSFELLNEVVDRDVAQIWNGIAERTIEAIRAFAPTIDILVGGVENNSISSLKLLAPPHDEHIVYNFHFYEPLIFTHQSAYWIKGMPTDFSIVYPNRVSEIVSNSKRYVPGLNTDQYESTENDQLDRNFFETAFSEAVRIAEKRNVPLYCGEYGVIDRADVSSTLNWYSDLNSTFEKYGISRAAWTYKEKDFGITGEHYAPIFDRLVKLL